MENLIGSGNRVYTGSGVYVNIAYVQRPRVFSARKKGGSFMGMLALVLGILGGLSAVTGIITAAEVISPIGTEFTWLFWFSLAGILLLAAITCLSSRGGYE